MQLYHNANTSDVHSSSAQSNRTTEQPQTQGHGWREDADIGYKSTPVIE